MDGSDGRKKLAILGFGAFGRFMARHLTPHFRVCAWNRTPRPEEARALGVELVSLEEAAGAEIVVLAVPVQNLREILGSVAPHLRPEALVLDVCSTKVRPVAWMRELLPETCRIVATHPLLGPQSGRDGIAGLRVVLCPVRGPLASVREFLAGTLALRVIETTPEEHDRQMAYVQALNHFIARALKRIGLPESELATPAYERLREMHTILAQDSLELFLTIERENPYAAGIREEFMAALCELEETIGPRAEDAGLDGAT